MMEGASHELRRTLFVYSVSGCVKGIGDVL